MILLLPSAELDIVLVIIMIENFALIPFQVFLVLFQLFSKYFV